MQNYCSEARYLPEKGQLEYYSNKPLLLQSTLQSTKVLLQDAPTREYKNKREFLFIYF